MSKEPERARQRISNVTEIMFTDRTLDWISELAKIFGKPENYLTPQTHADSSQETAVYQLSPQSNSGGHSSLITIARGFSYHDPYFKLHIEQAGEQQDDRYFPHIVKMQVDNQAQRADFFAIDDNSQLKLVAQVFASGEVKTLSETVR